MTAAGPLVGLRVIELCDERGAFAGKLLSDMGAEVIKVEPPEGDPTRRYPPFVDDEPHPERSLYFWHYNAGKRSATLDLESGDDRQRFRQLVAGADIFVESQRPGRLAALGLDYDDLHEHHERLIMVSITPFGRSGPRTAEQATDLTILAGGGPVWSCGYDDHSLPPIRAGGNQGYQTGCHFGVMSIMVALLAREQSGRGQLIDVNLHAASNVTTEAATYTWLVSRETVQRQTGRHAATRPTMPLQIRCADGRYVNTGVPPRTPAQFAHAYRWIESLGLLGEFDQAAILEASMEGATVQLAAAEADHDARAKLVAGRAAMTFLAEHLSAYEFFTGSQQRGFQTAIVYAPEEALADPQFIARGFGVDVEHPELSRTVRYPGAPFHFSATPWQLRRRPPLLGEDNAAVLAELAADTPSGPA